MSDQPFSENSQTEADDHLDQLLASTDAELLEAIAFAQRGGVREQRVTNVQQRSRTSEVRRTQVLEPGPMPTASAQTALALDPDTTTTRPRRKLGPISADAGSPHHEWLTAMRDSYLISNLTLAEVSERAACAKSSVSELLRGTGLYPRWGRVVALLKILRPFQPADWFKALWAQGALEAGKTDRWIRRNLEEEVRMGNTPGATPTANPVVRGEGQ